MKKKIIFWSVILLMFLGMYHVLKHDMYKKFNDYELKKNMDQPVLLEYETIGTIHNIDTSDLLFLSPTEPGAFVKYVNYKEFNDAMMEFNQELEKLKTENSTVLHGLNEQYVKQKEKLERVYNTVFEGEAVKGKPSSDPLIWKTDHYIHNHPVINPEYYESIKPDIVEP